METKFHFWERKKTASSWFDYECVIARRNVLNLLCTFRKSVSTNDREPYSQSRREYKNKLKHKKKLYKQLSEFDRCPRKSIRLLKESKSDSIKACKTCRYSVDTWFQHIRTISETNDSVNHKVENNTPDQVVDNVEENVGVYLLKIRIYHKEFFLYSCRPTLRSNEDKLQ